MTVKYLNLVSVVTTLVTWNISFIAAFYGTGYSAMSVPKTIFGCTTIFGHRIKVKKCLKLVLLLLGLNILQVAIYFIAEVQEQGIAQIGAIWQHFQTQIAFWVIVILVGALFFSYVFVQSKQNIYTGEEIDSKYIDFTKAVGTDQEIFIIAGDFGFLGRVPKSTAENFDQCAAVLKNLLETHIPECNCSADPEQCKNCIMKKAQFRQLADMVKNKSVSLKILCRKPHNEEEDYQITLGYFLAFFPRLQIRFYTGQNGKCPDLPLRGRIIGTAQKNQKMFSHFVLETNQYQEMAVCDTNSAEGRTYIGLASALWEAASDPTTTGQLRSIRNLYKTYISTTKQAEQDQDGPG